MRYRWFNSVRIDQGPGRILGHILPVSDNCRTRWEMASNSEFVHFWGLLRDLYVGKSLDSSLPSELTSPGGRFGCFIPANLVFCSFFKCKTNVYMTRKQGLSLSAEKLYLPFTSSSTSRSVSPSNSSLPSSSTSHYPSNSTLSLSLSLSL